MWLCALAVVAKTSRTSRHANSRTRCHCSLRSQKGKHKPLATDKPGKELEAVDKNKAAIMILTPEVAAATRL